MYISDEGQQRTMAMLFGRLNKFRPGADRLSVYLEQFELYCTTNSFPDGMYTCPPLTFRRQS